MLCCFVVRFSRYSFKNLPICFSFSLDEDGYDDLLKNYEFNYPYSNDDELFENQELNGPNLDDGELFKSVMSDPNLNPGFSIEEFRQDQLDLHNHYRSLHGAQPMTRDEE